MIWVWLMTVYHKNDSWVQARVCYTHPVDECSSMTQTGSCETIHHRWIYYVDEGQIIVILLLYVGDPGAI